VNISDWIKEEVFLLGEFQKWANSQKESIDGNSADWVKSFNNWQHRHAQKYTQKDIDKSTEFYEDMIRVVDAVAKCRYIDTDLEKLAKKLVKELGIK
jgi:hypothetical protein